MWKKITHVERTNYNKNLFNYGKALFHKSSYKYYE